MFITSYLTNSYQLCKIGESFSEWERIIAVVPQGSIFGLLLFNIFINDIFLYIENSDLCNSAYGGTLYVSGESLCIIIGNLKVDFLKISKWFHKTFMALNPDKCNFMVLSESNCICNFTCNGTIIKSNKKEKVLGIIFTSTNQKLYALSRVKCYMGFEQNTLIMLSFIKSQFSSRTSMNMLNNIHEKCLRLITNDYVSNFNELLELSHGLSIHKTCINYLMVEVYKHLHGLTPELMSGGCNSVSC